MITKSLYPCMYLNIIKNRCIYPLHADLHMLHLPGLGISDFHFLTSTRVDHEIVAIDVSRFVASLPWEKQSGNRRQQPQRVVNDEEKKHKFLKIWVPAMVEVESLQFAVVFAHIPPNTKESKIPATLYIKAFTSPTKITRHPKRDIPKHLADRTTCSFCLHLSADLTVGPPLAVISMTSMTLYSSLSGNVPGNSPLVKHQTWHLQPNLVPTNRKNCKTIHPKPTLSVFKPTPNLFSPASQPAPVAWKVLHSSTFPSPSRPPPLNTASARGPGHVSDALSRPQKQRGHERLQRLVPKTGYDR